MSQVASAILHFTADDKQALKSMSGLEKAMVRFSQRAEAVGRFSRNMLLGIGGAVALAVRAAADSEKQEARLAAVLRATGNAAGFSTQQLKAYAAQLQKISTFDDDAIIGAQSRLAAFTNVRGEQFLRTMQAALDVSAATGGDLESVTEQLGKALHTPAEGLKSLADLLGKLSTKEKEAIARMQSHGRVADAQDAVLALLESRYAGVARAMSQTFGGKLTQIKNQLGDVAEEIGGSFIPHLNGIQDRLIILTPKIREFVAANADMIVKVTAASAALASMGFVLPGLIKGMSALWLVTRPVGIALVAMGPIVTALLGSVAAFGMVIDRVARKTESWATASYKVLTQISGMRRVLGALSGTGAGVLGIADAMQKHGALRLDIQRKRAELAGTNAADERFKRTEELVKLLEEQLKVEMELARLESTPQNQNRVNTRREEIETIKRELAQGINVNLTPTSTPRDPFSQAAFKRPEFTSLIDMNRRITVGAMGRGDNAQATIATEAKRQRVLQEKIAQHAEKTNTLLEKIKDGPSPAVVGE